MNSQTEVLLHNIICCKHGERLSSKDHRSKNNANNHIINELHICFYYNQR